MTDSSPPPDAGRIDPSGREREHSCGRCNEMFPCQHGPLCKAGAVVMPNIVQADLSIREHCPLKPDWDWIRAYGDRRRAQGHIEAVRVYSAELTLLRQTVERQQQEIARLGLELRETKARLEAWREGGPRK